MRGGVCTRAGSRWRKLWSGVERGVAEAEFVRGSRIVWSDV